MQDAHPHDLTPAQRGVIASRHPRWVVSGPPRSGVSGVILGRVRRALDAGQDADRVLALVVDRRAARQAEVLLERPDDGVPQVTPLGYAAFAQLVITGFWPLAAERLGIADSTPVFLPFDLAQYACREEYLLRPGALQRLTIREPRLIVQLLDNINLAAANGISLEEAWRRVAGGLGVAPDDDVIRDGLDLTERFRARCIAAGALPWDLQIETCAWLLGLREVRAALAARYDLLAVDGLDEFVPAIVSALCTLAGEIDQVAIGYCPDGGLRWMLGASARHAAGECDNLLAGEHGFRRLCLRHPGNPLRDTAQQLGRLIARPDDPPAAGSPPPRWSLSIQKRPDQMAAQVILHVAGLVDSGVPPQEIALLTPYVDPVVAGELTRGFADARVPFRVEQRWRSLVDDPHTRACLTALRLALPAAEPGGRRATQLELADLLGTLLGTNPVAAQRIAMLVWDPGRHALRSRDDVVGRLQQRDETLPGAVGRLLAWADTEREQPAVPLDARLARLVDGVCVRQPEMADAGRRLERVTARFVEAAPRLGFSPPVDDAFFSFIDSDVIAAADLPADDPPAVRLTTPLAFLTSGGVARYQCWLDAAAPAWWEPPLLLLSNPHAIGDDAALLPFTLEHEECVRARVLGRVLRSLAARAGEAIDIFAATSGIDGEPLDGPLLDALEAAGVARR